MAVTVLAMRNLLTLVALGLFSLSVCAAAMPSAAQAQLSVEEERAVQIAAMSTGYAFGALYTAVGVFALAKGEPLDRSWIPGLFMSAITFAGISLGYITQAAAFSTDPNDSAAYAMSSPPGIMLGGLDIALGIDAIYRGSGDYWMDTGPAIITLIHGLALSTFGLILSFAGATERAPLENVLPIYTWSVTGAILAIYSAVSLFAN